MARHWFTKNQRCQKLNTDAEQKSPTQIGDENKFLRQCTASPQDTYGVFIAEMMKG